MSDIRMLPGQTDRVETGAVQFGEDWPGLFIRGDNCVYYRMCLQTVLRLLKELPPDKFIDALAVENVRSLAELMTTPIVHPHKEEFLRNISGLADLT
jgi:hypothetical protein